MPPWIERPSIQLDLQLPPEKRLAALTEDAAIALADFFQGIRREFTAGTLSLAEHVSKNTKGRFDAEMKAAAWLLGLDWREVAVANAAYDIALASMGCSTVALATTDGPVLARNMDWWPEDLVARATYRVQFHDGPAPRFISLGWPGATGVVTGMSSRGFAIALNAALSREGANLTGYPVLLLIRRVLEEATGFNQAFDILKGLELASSAIFTLIGTENRQRVIIERTPTKSAVRRPRGDSPLLATNDFREMREDLEFARERNQAALHALHSDELYQTTCSRYEALERLTLGLGGNKPVHDEHLLFVLSDPDVIQSITAQHTILRPRDSAARVFVPQRLL